MANWKHDGYHPIWSCIRLFLYLLLVFAVLACTASHFDATELKAIGLIAIGLSTGEFIIPRFRKQE